MNGNTCSCKHHWIVPGCIFIIGLLMLIGNLGINLGIIGQYALPVLLMVIGLSKVFTGGCGCCQRG